MSRERREVWIVIDLVEECKQVARRVQVAQERSDRVVQDVVQARACVGESAAGLMAIVSSSRPSKGASSRDVSETESSSGDSMLSRGGASSRGDAGSSRGDAGDVSETSPQEATILLRKLSCATAAAAKRSWNMLGGARGAGMMQGTSSPSGPER